MSSFRNQAFILVFLLTLLLNLNKLSAAQLALRNGFRCSLHMIFSEFSFTSLFCVSVEIITTSLHSEFIFDYCNLFEDALCMVGRWHSVAWNDGTDWKGGERKTDDIETANDPLIWVSSSFVSMNPWLFQRTCSKHETLKKFFKLRPSCSSRYCSFAFFYLIMQWTSPLVHLVLWPNMWTVSLCATLNQLKMN